MKVQEHFESILPPDHLDDDAWIEGMMLRLEAMRKATRERGMYFDAAIIGVPLEVMARRGELQPRPAHSGGTFYVQKPGDGTIGLLSRTFQKETQ